MRSVSSAHKSPSSWSASLTPPKTYTCGARQIAWKRAALSARWCQPSCCQPSCLPACLRLQARTLSLRAAAACAERGGGCATLLAATLVQRTVSVDSSCSADVAPASWLLPPNTWRHAAVASAAAAAAAVAAAAAAAATAELEHLVHAAVCLLHGSRLPHQQLVASNHGGAVARYADGRWRCRFVRLLPPARAHTRAREHACDAAAAARLLLLHIVAAAAHRRCCCLAALQARPVSALRAHVSVSVLSTDTSLPAPSAWPLPGVPPSSTSLPPAEHVRLLNSRSHGSAPRRRA